MRVFGTFAIFGGVSQSSLQTWVMKEEYKRDSSKQVDLWAREFELSLFGTF